MTDTLTGRTAPRLRSRWKQALAVTPIAQLKTAWEVLTGIAWVAGRVTRRLGRFYIRTAFAVLLSRTKQRTVSDARVLRAPRDGE